MALPQNWLDELLARSSLVEIAGKYLTLERKGGSFWACCPFHHEKTPSFKIDGDSNLYYCFGCHAGGNVITFVRNIENIDFLEAVKHLAERARMTLPEREYGDETHALKQKKDKLLSALRAAAGFYHDALKDARARPAVEYMERRGIDARAAARFGLGYSPNWTDMPEYMASRGFTAAELREAGLAGEKNGRVYDVFAGRLMFPIINNFGDVISFGGRILTADASAAKYRNGAQTAVFDKSRALYAINFLKKVKAERAVPYVIIAEGYMDVITLHLHGFDTAVASMGTSLTAYQARTLRNYAERVHICYDGDSAGRAATLRGLDILKDAGLDVKVVSLPDGLDPDDMLRKRGKEAFSACLSAAPGLYAFKLEYLKGRSDLKTPEGRVKYADAALKIIGETSSPVEREEYLKIVRADTGYTMDVLKRQLETGAAISARPAADSERAASAVGAVDEDKAARFILCYRLTAPDADFSFDLSPYLVTEFCKKLNGMIVAAAAEGRRLKAASLYEILDERDSAALGALLNYGAETEGGGARYYADCARKLENVGIGRRIEELSRGYDAAVGAEEKRRILADIERLETLKRKNKNYIGGSEK